MLRLGHVIALGALALLTLGVVMVNSASMGVRLVEAGAPGPAVITPESIMFSKSTLYMVLALAAMALASRLPVRRVGEVIQARLGVGRGGLGRGGSDLSARTSPGLEDSATPSAGAAGDQGARATYVRLAIGAALLIGLCGMVYLPVVGRAINGSHRWVGVPGTGSGADGLTMQPSEIAKWAFIGLMAWYATARAASIHRFWSGLVPALIAIGGVAGFVVLEDLGTGALIAAVGCVVLLAGGARLWQFLLFVPVGAALFVVAIVTSEYRMKRITAFLDPYADPEKTGYHMIQSLMAISNGNGFGRGLGHGLQKFEYLPEKQTDFIFAVICEELGIPGAGLVIGLFVLLVWAGLAIGRKEPDRLLRLFVLGVTCTVGFQAIMNLAVVTALAPTKGIALPLLSSGGTGWILTAFSLGLIVSIDRTREDREAAAREAEPLDGAGVSIPV